MERHLVKTRHGYVHLRTGGSGDGTPLVLLHMTPQSSRQFDRIAPLLGDLKRGVAIPADVRDRK